MFTELYRVEKREEVPGSSPGWIQGFPREDGIGERIDKRRKRQRLELTGLRRKPIKPVTSGLH